MSSNSELNPVAYGYNDRNDNRSISENKRPS